MLLTSLDSLQWGLSILITIALLIAVALCACTKRKEKSDLGIEGRLALKRDSPQVPKLQWTEEDKVNGQVNKNLSLERVSIHPGTPNKPVTERALPTPPGRPQSLPTSISVQYVGKADTIPRVSVSGNSDSRSSTLVRPHRRNKAQAPKPPTSDNTSPKCTKEVNGLLPASSLPNGNIRSKSMELEETSQKTHSSVTAVQAGSVPDSLSSDASLYADPLKLPQPVLHGEVKDVPPPVPEKRFDGSPKPEVPERNSSSRSSQQNQVFEEHTGGIASQAVSGQLPSAEIPYMTPPLNVTEEAVTSEGRGSEIPYTVISVREPLAKVREETIRQRQKALQNSRSQEGYYTEVPEDEQMYAEIESGHNSAESSVTYARIEPRDPDQPPAPPTVESLKSVAQAHSRQASVASAASLFGGTSPSGDPSTLYSSVDKSVKQRRTIHVAEGVSAFTVERPLDDLYAKVHKKCASTDKAPVSFDVPETDSDDVFVSQRPHSLPTDGTYTPEPSTETYSGEPVSCPPNIWAEYADPGYERVKHQDSSDTDPCYEQVGGGRDESDYEKIERNSECTDPGYEKIKKSGEPGYETIEKSDCEDDGEYEKIGRSHYERLNQDIIPKELGYKQMKDSHSSDSQSISGQVVTDSSSSEKVDLTEGDSSDPGYEQIKCNSSTSSNQSHSLRMRSKFREELFDNDNPDPGYETVHHPSESSNFMVHNQRYSVHRNDSITTDPGYEKVRSRTSSQEEFADPGYEAVQCSQGRSTSPSIRMEISSNGVHNISESNSDFVYETVPSQSEIHCPYKQNSSVSSSLKWKANNDSDIDTL